jgi:hypothetical protein
MASPGFNLAPGNLLPRSRGFAARLERGRQNRGSELVDELLESTMKVLNLQPFTTFEFQFGLGVADLVFLTIANDGGDNVGVLLDNVRLVSRDIGPTPVPEPGTFALMGAGLLVAARQVRRRYASSRKPATAR